MMLMGTSQFLCISRLGNKSSHVSGLGVPFSLAGSRPRP